MVDSHTLVMAFERYVLIPVIMVMVWEYGYGHGVRFSNGVTVMISEKNIREFGNLL